MSDMQRHDSILRRALRAVASWIPGLGEDTASREGASREGRERPRPVGISNRPLDNEQPAQEHLPPRGTARGEADPALPPRPGEAPPPADPTRTQQTASEPPAEEPARRIGEPDERREAERRRP